MTEDFAIKEARRRTDVLGKPHWVGFVIGSDDPAHAFLVLDRKADSERVIIVGEEKITPAAELLREDAKRLGLISQPYPSLDRFAEAHATLTRPC